MHDRKSRKVQLGIIILLVIGLLIATFVWYVWTINFYGKKGVPQFTSICERYGDDYLITLTSLKYLDPPAGYFRYRLEYPNGTLLESKHCHEIYNTDPTFRDDFGNPITNVSLYDLDKDGNLGVGDTFLIRGENNTEIYNNKGECIQGIGKEGVVFKLIFTPTGQSSGSLTLADNTPVNTTFVKHHPLNKWSVIPIPIPQLVLPNITISTSEPALSSYPPMMGQNVSIALTLNNSDNMSASNISVKFFDDNIEIESIENISIDAMNKTKILIYHRLEYAESLHNITLSVMLGGMNVIQCYCNVDVVESPPLVSSSFHTDITIILFVAVIVALMMSYCKVKSQRYKKC